MVSGGKRRIRIWRRIPALLRENSGAVTMEYALLCVLIAAASVMMVVSFSRAVTRQIALVSYAMSGYSEEELQEAQERFREDSEDDAVVGSVYSDYMHGERVTK